MYFLRQYLKGVKGSGTKDIWTGDFVPTENEILETFGDNGKLWKTMNAFEKPLKIIEKPWKSIWKPLKIIENH